METASMVIAQGRACQQVAPDPQTLYDNPLISSSEASSAVRR